ncbi:hypothetical protein EOA60_01940 [Mesorhizobium sp. M1A.F.Ca.IN.020.06.1.1]|uniref:hypothetical protein n=1 Tax=unclassified Mesorhizobium TaxID=325217 RepID=UPI000BAF6871|nr:MULTISPECIES: hypothetical protein [unclassified Mesorhizobium]MDG4888050.1 hypothetical protein [Mesorhizobium sp. WSM4887]PBB29907.1 hypothetical protein CK214_22585 [Mesorhizobium sp. WSM3882]PBB42703.1 hypothetical protein CK222_16285 [Mesorhizobium sp. WSM3866]RUV06953.1 hypothetical protein EOA79_06775 [Mesorhizobium sp. M1A.F.Ca.IN.020.03.2.1]RUV89932.1 hypothetical protein EOA51_01340 [Mesorhizobium sp. M1A.F.Ca.IN.020.32.1.1]
MAGLAMRTFPLSPNGSAAEAVLPNGQLIVTDLAARSRFGIKGPGSSAWLEAQGLSLPPVNRIAIQGGVRLLRLGSEDFLAIDDIGAGGAAAKLIADWQVEKDPRGYWSWREEGWSWMRLSGQSAEAVMARLCALDLRPARFADDEIAQTRVAHLEAVLVRSVGGFDIFFDIASTAFFIRTVDAAAQLADGDTTTRENHR